MSEERMLPCPFCGSENLRIRCNPIHKNWNAMSAVACDDCYTQGPTVPGDEAAIKAWNALPRALRWTKEPPSKPGWYWWKEYPKGDSTVVLVSYLSIGDFSFMVSRIDNNESTQLRGIGGFWAGPIPEPKEK